MERVAFLIEPGATRIGCLLNPESLTVRRLSGITKRETAGGAIAGRGLSDDVLQFTGGGTTEIDLALLFDIGLAGSTIASCDVRDLTAPLWQLSENASEDGSYGCPPTVRFVWGKGWNIPGVIAAVSERLDDFSADGIPRRSWLRLRLIRVPEPAPRTAGLGQPLIIPQLPDVLEAQPAVPADDAPVHEVLGGTVESEGSDANIVRGDRIDTIAFRYCGDPAAWRLIAYMNDLVDPLRIAAGTLLRLPQALAARVKS